MKLSNRQYTPLQALANCVCTTNTKRTQSAILSQNDRASVFGSWIL